MISISNVAVRRYGGTLRRINRTRGFTIVELLIVIVVIAILAAIVIVSYNGIVSRAKYTAEVQEIAQYANAMNAYTIAYSAYPYIGADSTQVACLYASPLYTNCAAAAAAQAGQPSRISLAVTSDLMSKLQPNSITPETGFTTYTTVSYATVATPIVLDDGMSTYSGVYIYSLFPGNVNPCPVISGTDYLSRTYPTSGSYTACRFTLTAKPPGP